MNIKRRLRISYILMLLIPTSLIVLTGGIIRRVYDPVREYADLPDIFYRELYATMAQDPERLLAEDYLRELENQSGYRGRINMYVSRERSVVNSLENIQIRMNGNDGYPMIIFTDWDFRYSDGIPGEFSFFVSDSERISGAYFSVGGILLAAVVVLLLANGLLSWHMARTITKPLVILEEAAHQIKEEDLETPVLYDGIDEYQRVCTAFEAMRIRLKDSLHEQLRYEENRKELLASISHDLKTPITAIKGYIEGIRDGIADTPEKVDKYLDTIYGKSVLMNDLINRLFLFSKLDLGKIQFQFQRIALGAFLSDTCDELRFDYPTMKIRLDEPKQEIYVDADATHLHRVITNLLDNSEKYGGNDNVAVNISVESKGTMAELTIRDNGPGIDDEMLPHIFERFYRGDASRSSRREGSGLGLSIARQIITAHGGSITAKNSRNGGLEIRLTLRLTNEKDTYN